MRLTVLAGIGCQAMLALSWIPEPQRLFNGLFPPDVWQPSLFPTAVMLSLPKFGPHADIGYAPNSIWTFAALLLLAAGFLRSPRLRCIPLAMVAVLVPLVLPVEDALKRSSQTVLRRYEAEHFCRSVVTGAFPISRSRAHTHRRHGHPLQTVPSAGLIERPQEKNRVDALR